MKNNMTTQEATEIMMALEELRHSIDRAFEKAENLIRTVSTKE